MMTKLYGEIDKVELCEMVHHWMEENHVDPQTPAAVMKPFLDALLTDIKNEADGGYGNIQFRREYLFVSLGRLRRERAFMERLKKVLERK